MQDYQIKYRKNCKGNILFIILISVGLFAALTYTVAKSSRTASYSQESDDHAKIQEVLSFAEKVETAVNRIHFQNDCRTSYINFHHATDDGYTNPVSPESHRCDVFSYEGGAIKYFSPPSQLLDTKHKGDSLYGEYIFTGNVCIDGIGSGTEDSCSSDGVQNEELIIFLPWVKESVCRQINAILDNPKLIEDAGGSFDDTKFTGTFSDGFVLSDNAGSKTYKVGCFKSNTSPGDGYHFYYTLMEK